MIICVVIIYLCTNTLVEKKTNEYKKEIEINFELLKEKLLAKNLQRCDYEALTAEFIRQKFFEPLLCQKLSLEDTLEQMVVYINSLLLFCDYNNRKNPYFILKIPIYEYEYQCPLNMENIAKCTAESIFFVNNLLQKNPEEIKEENFSLLDPCYCGYVINNNMEYIQQCSSQENTIPKIHENEYTSLEEYIIHRLVTNYETNTSVVLISLADLLLHEDGIGIYFKSLEDSHIDYEKLFTQVLLKVTKELGLRFLKMFEKEKENRIYAFETSL